MVAKGVRSAQSAVILEVLLQEMAALSGCQQINPDLLEQ